MRRYLGWAVATALLVLEVSAEVSFVANAEAAGGTFEKKQDSVQPKDNKESSFHQSTDEKIGQLRGTATTEKASAPPIATLNLPTGKSTSSLFDEKTTAAPHSMTDSITGEKHQGGAQAVDVSWASKLRNNTSTLSDPATDEFELRSRRVEEASTNAPNSVPGDSVPWIELLGSSEESVQPETEPPRKYSEGGMETTIVDDEYVRWNQNDCHPCVVPTQPPTFAPLYPHQDDDYDEHLPTVTDDYKRWEDIKEDLKSYSDVSTNAPTPPPNYPPNDDDYEEHLPIVNDEYDSWEDLKETYLPDTPADIQGPYDEEEEGDYDEGLEEEHEGEYIHCTTVITDYGESYECNEEPTETPSEPPGEVTTALPVDTTPPDGTTFPPAETTPPEGTTAPPTPTERMTTPPTESTPKPNEPTPAPSEPDEPTPAPTGSGDEPTPTPAATTPDGETTYPGGSITTTRTPSTSTGTTATGGTTITDKTTTGTANANTGTTTTGTDSGTAANASTSAGNTASTGDSSDALSAGAIAGIVLGCAVFVAVVVGAVLFRQKALARQREENLFADLSDTGGGFEMDYAAM